MTTIIFQAGWAVPLMGLATNGSCHPSCRNGLPASRAGPCRPMGWSDNPSTTHWLVLCQARPMALRAVPCLGQAKFRMPYASPFGPTQKYRTKARVVRDGSFVQRWLGGTAMRGAPAMTNKVAARSAGGRRGHDAGPGGLAKKAHADRQH
jgi:hypothetical protein